MGIDILAVAVVNLVVGVGIGIVLDRLRSRPRIFYWYPHAFVHQLKLAEDQPTVKILTDTITIQNVGRKSAESVEICLTGEPDRFELSPSLKYEAETDEDGNYIIRIMHLGSKEVFAIEFLSYKTKVKLNYVRHKDGPAEKIDIVPIRQFPLWVYYVSAVFTLIGTGLVLYWIALIGEFIARGIGWIS